MLTKTRDRWMSTFTKQSHKLKQLAPIQNMWQDTNLPCASYKTGVFLCGRGTLGSTWSPGLGWHCYFSAHFTCDSDTIHETKKTIHEIIVQYIAWNDTSALCQVQCGLQKWSCYMWWIYSIVDLVTILGHILYIAQYRR